VNHSTLGWRVIKKKKVEGIRVRLLGTEDAAEEALLDLGQRVVVRRDHVLLWGEGLGGRTVDELEFEGVVLLWGEGLRGRFRV